MSSAPQLQPERNGSTLSRPVKLGESLVAIAIGCITLIGGMLTLGMHVGAYTTQADEQRVAIERQAHDIQEMQKSKADKSDMDDVNRRMEEIDNKLDELKNILLQRRR